jgi:hypothetical protein
MKRVLLMTVGGLVLATTAMAGMEDTRFALYRKALTSKTTTLCTTYTPNGEIPPRTCRDYVVTGPANSQNHVYMMAAHAGTEGVSAVSFGIDYAGGPTGINPAFVAVTWCADGLPFPNDGGNGEFPKPRGGVRVTWNLPGSCQTTVIGNEGVHAVIGALYVYAYGGQLMMTPNNNLVSGIPELAVANCAGAELNLYTFWGPAIANQIVGTVGFGGAAGYNPCFITPTKSSTWGNIKNKYNH